MTGPVLIVRGVQRLHRTRDGEPVGVHDISFEIERGQTVALLGPNGSGKSTLLKLIATADMPQRGEIEIAGVRVHRGWSPRERARARAALGVVFQSPSLDPLLTVRENLLAASALLSLGGAEACNRVDASMESVKIADRARDRVGTLSGGLKRRADLARALLGSPALLILDEPTTGLDPDARARLLETLDELRSREDAPAILHSTHLTDEAERADRVLFIDRGRLAAAGTPGELRARVGRRALILEDGTGPASGVIERFGLDTRTLSRSRRLVKAAGEPLEQVIVEMNRAGAAFSIGPPTLADAYSAVVGRGLDEEGGTP